MDEVHPDLSADGLLVAGETEGLHLYNLALDQRLSPTQSSFKFEILKILVRTSSFF